MIWPRWRGNGVKGKEGTGHLLNRRSIDRLPKLILGEAVWTFAVAADQDGGDGVFRDQVYELFCLYDQ